MHLTVLRTRVSGAFCKHFALVEQLSDHILSFSFDLIYRKALIEKGIYHIPIACKQGSISYSHSEKDIEKTLDITELVLKNIL